MGRILRYIVLNTYKNQNKRMSDELTTNRGVLRLSAVLADTLRLRDVYTRLHSDRVMALADGMGREMGLTQSELHVLELGASLHDIGKIVVPDRVLMKPDRLNDEEMAQMQQHPSVGAELIGAYEHPRAGRVAHVVRHHHEWFNGKGYPDGLAGEAIPLLARIVSVVDSYDAMAVRRVYHGARKHDEVVSIMASESGSKLDPMLLEVFFKVIEHPAFASFKAE